MDIILEKSLINSHCKGLDSLVIKDAPRMVRIFVARKDHELWRNSPKEIFSVGLHTHHCDITLVPILGDIQQIRLNPMPGSFIAEMRPYRYVSPIGKQSEGKFELLNPGWKNFRLTKERLNEPQFMKAKIPHSVYVPKGKEAAWMIWEGAEDPDYNSITWSNDYLENFSFEGYNLPMTEERLKEDLEILRVKR